MRRRRDESGIALLVVLLTITLLTIVVVEFTDFAQVETHLALSARNALQATYLARSGVNVAEALVSVDGRISPGSDSPADFWAKPYPPLPIGDGTAVFKVRDEARFLNLNDMLAAGSFNNDRYQVFVRLFKILGVDRAVLSAILDWIDGDGVPRIDPPGAEQPFYLGVRPPTFVRNAPLVTLRELLLVRHVTPTLLARLEGFVTVLPVGNLKVNVNTAPAEVLMALSDGTLGNPGSVARLITTRETEAFRSQGDIRSVTDFWEALGASGQGFVETSSPYFRLEGVGEIGDVRRGIVEVVKRDSARITRLSWMPSNANLTLTSLPPSDFLATLPVFGDDR